MPSGVIISKRQIGKALVFANIIPPREGMVVEQMGVRFMNKYALYISLRELFFIQIIRIDKIVYYADEHTGPSDFIDSIVLHK